jgi:signal transduction histidine kinase
LIKEELSKFADEELKYGFSGIESASKRLIRTIDLILNMSDVQLGTHDYFPKEVDICKDILDNLLLEYKVQLNDKKLDLNLIRMDGNLKIVCDSYTTNQIFANLIDNAVKYTKEGSITIECGRNDIDDLYISVLDTGVGISEKYMPNLFDEFSQEDMGYTRKFEGNGLGLALVKKYCELNNFEIFAESKKNIGSKFTVILKKERPEPKKQ